MSLTASSPKKESNYRVPSVVRTMAILEYVSKHSGATFTEIYTELKIPRTSAFQLLQTLLDFGLLRRSQNGIQYYLGFHLFELGSLAVTDIDLRQEAKPILRKLVIGTNYTCHLGLLDGLEAFYLLKIDGNEYFRWHSWEGQRFGLHCTAIGKTLLAWMDEERLDQILGDRPLPKRTERTITDPGRLREQLKIIRRRGWSLGDQENLDLVRAVAAPVFSADGRIIAGLGLSALAAQLDGEILFQVVDQVIRAANDLTRRMGGAGLKKILDRPFE